MTKSEVIAELRRALAFAQANHHGQAVRNVQHRGPHRGAHWQRYPSTSCQLAATAWRGSRDHAR